MKRAFTFVGIALLLLALYLSLWPSSIDPIAWEPTVHEPDRWKPTGTVAGADRIQLAGGVGPEDVEMDAEGRLYTGVEDGRVLVFDAPDRPPRTFANTGGR